MRSKIKLLLTLTLVLLVSLSFSYGSVTGQGVTPEKDPWLQKPVLHYLLYSSLTGEAQDLFKTLSLSEEEVSRLKEIAIEENQQIQVLYWEAQDAVRGKDRSPTAQDIALYNERVEKVLHNTDRAIRQLLGPRYLLFREWIREWWTREVETVTRLKQPVGTLSDASWCYVFATQYYGYTNYGVALPDKYVKFANLGWYIPPPWDSRYNNPPYTVNIYRAGYWVWNVLVREVGPWNTDDNYWDSALGYNARRMFTDIPLCWSEAEYAYYYNYNNGKDQFGRTVTVPSSVDLTPAVAADLGLKYLQNAWVYVAYSDLP
jgi:hypothetical protein